MNKSLSTVIVLGLLIGSPVVYAQDNHQGRAGYHGSHAYFHYHDHPQYGYHVHNFYANEYYPVGVRGVQYYYDDGVYYNNIGGDYVVAAPPIGAVVSTIPSDFQPVNINGVTYYTNNGTYYTYTSNGYKVVNPPVGNSVVTGSTIVVNVPSDRGGYVAVNLKRSGQGFIGPQGEFYASFPPVAQLRMIYGK